MDKDNPSQQSSASAQEQVLKKKLNSFLLDLQHWGTVAGFKHFSSYVRGREEIVLTINNSLESRYPGDYTSGQASRRGSVCPTPSDSLTSAQLPYDKGSLVLSHNTQLGLSGRREKGIGLPPASPSEAEGSMDEKTTLFLLAGYGRYLCPYVWVRSNHERLFKLSGDADSDRDSPLRLKSSARWKDHDIQPSDIISELVRLCTYPRPLNPFELDMDYFLSLPQPEQLLASAAMTALLQRIVVHTPDSKAYAGKVSEDLQQISRLHFKCLSEMVEAGSLPVMKQPQQQQRGLHHRNRQHQQPRQVPTQQRPTGPTTTQQRPTGPTTTQQRPTGPTTTQQRPTGPTTTQQRPTGPTTTQQRPTGPTTAQRQNGVGLQQQYSATSQQYPPKQQPSQHRPQHPPQSQQPSTTQQQQTSRQYNNSTHFPPTSQQAGYPPGFKCTPSTQTAHSYPNVSQQARYPPGFKPPPSTQTPHIYPNASQQAGYPPGFKPPPSTVHSYPQYPLPQQPINPNASRVYGQGPRGAFPGGFERTPAPSLL